MEKKLIEMKQKRASLVSESEKVFAELLENKNDELKAKYESIEKEIASLDSDIAGIEKVIERKATVIVEDKPEEKTKVNENELFEAYLKGEVLNEDIANGDVLAPTDVENTVIKLAKDYNIMESIADVRTADHDKDIPVETSIGSSGWLDDGGFTTDNLALSSVSMKAYALGRNLVVKRSIVEDASINTSEYVFDAFGRSNAKLAEQAYFTGNGTGKPTGVITSATSLDTKNSLSFTFDDLKALYYSVAEEYRRNGTFIFSEEILQTIHSFTDGNGNYIFDQNKPLTAIWGRPVYTVPYLASDAGTAGNVIGLFGDFSKYRIQKRKGVGVEVLKEKNAPDYTYLIYERVDGKLLVAEAITKLVVKA